jgi:hypothetical protein
LDSSRALLVGAMHLLQLFAQRHAGTAWFPDWLATRTGRVISKLLDMCQPADRLGRWLPDPTVLPAVAAPAPCPSSSEVEWIGEMARLAQALTEIIGGIPPLAAVAVTAIAKDPAGWKALVDEAAQDQTYAEAVLGLVSQYSDIANVLMAKLFQLDDLNHFDDELRSATAAFRDTVRDLFNQLRRVLPKEPSRRNMKRRHVDQQVAVRAWTQTSQRRRQRRRSVGHRPSAQHILVFDTETTIDETQALLYGAFRYCRVDGLIVTTVAEGLIYADDLPDRDPAGYALLRSYAVSHKADVDGSYLRVEPNWELQLLSRTEFVNKWVWHVGYYPHNKRDDPAAIVAFNAPFDFSRIAVDVAEARGDLYGGFSLILWADPDGTPTRWRPRLAIKSLDSKRAIKKFRKLERGNNDFAGHLLDLRTLVFALTGASHSLDSACAAYGVEGKAAAPKLGVITEEAIDYCRQDVAATARLYQAAMVEYSTHPNDLPATAAYSPASIAKKYLSKMGIQPRLTTQPDFPSDVLGYAMSAFHGGRAEVHLRHVPAPVAVVDFTSMYPTVDTLMGIWQLVTADRVDVLDVTEEIRQLLDPITAGDCFNPGPWRDLVVITEIIPDGDVVPVRADYATPLLHLGAPSNWSIGVNPLRADQPFWYALPDLIASKILTSRTPAIRRALRFVPAGGQQAGLQPVALQGLITIDPRSEDFFQRVVEARQELHRSASSHPRESCLCEICRVARFLKVLANSGSYGIYAQMDRQQHADTVTVYGPTGVPFTTKKMAAPEEPGEYCFPPIAACITGAARLMLALLEHTVEEAGGTWMFCDTDSMAIVATEDGGDWIRCPDGQHRLPDGTPAIKALSYRQVDEIRARFNVLNPYNKDAVPQLLKLDHTGICYAISAKRYVVYSQDDSGDLQILDPKEHGLGAYLDPLTSSQERRDANGNRIWINEAWGWILAAHHNPDVALPTWADRPAVSPITISSTALWRPFRLRNRGRSWVDQIKPFNFLMVATIDPFGYPPGIDPTKFRLIATYNDNPDSWANLEWRNIYDTDGRSYRITTDRDAPAAPDLVVVKSYADVLREYRIHPEYKFNGPDGQPCRRNTRGLLQRRPVELDGPVRLIGKEANNIEEVQAGRYAQLDEIITEYVDPDDDHFHQQVMPLLEHMSAREIARLVGADRRTIGRIRKGEIRTPGAALRQALTRLAVGIRRADPASQLNPSE